MKNIHNYPPKSTCKKIRSNFVGRKLWKNSRSISLMNRKLRILLDLKSESVVEFTFFEPEMEADVDGSRKIVSSSTGSWKPWENSCVVLTVVSPEVLRMLVELAWNNLGWNDFIAEQVDKEYFDAVEKQLMEMYSVEGSFRCSSTTGIFRSLRSSCMYSFPSWRVSIWRWSAHLCM